MHVRISQRSMTCIIPPAAQFTPTSSRVPASAFSNPAPPDPETDAPFCSRASEDSWSWLASSDGSRGVSWESVRHTPTSPRMDAATATRMAHCSGAVPVNVAIWGRRQRCTAADFRGNARRDVALAALSLDSLHSRLGCCSRINHAARHALLPPSYSCALLRGLPAAFPLHRPVDGFCRGARVAVWPEFSALHHMNQHMQVSMHAMPARETRGPSKAAKRRISAGLEFIVFWGNGPRYSAGLEVCLELKIECVMLKVESWIVGAGLSCKSLPDQCPTPPSLLIRFIVC
ncbi:hypothetical protein IQ07DRAFT_601407 [Pyrenochaeta sp. DS3sAY3a]|nr:hypothetical protein IQ07DRAFT_601407 [Pyrenochaeta sp. DS3sAY3a]